MSTLGALLLSASASAAVLLWLTATDPKRRRVYGLPGSGRRTRRGGAIALVLLLAPGVVLIAAGQAAAFVIWSGVLTLLGWGIARRAPAGTLRAFRKT